MGVLKYRMRNSKGRRKEKKSELEGDEISK